ncbi:hypothetical protein HT665_01420 [Ursidibacter maritimus]|uniref:Uncharacterized protein n=1 Tax=Ursidibacter maritimus TaxID=1331689 RepID=A0A949T4Y6_9PAST|nr:hypothetical protein [Ursidibacter maritimus]KAE9539234.1 hypothetical protein A1D26_04210 [Ursidibacter maritimus]MBV6524592.1 hypothetical protein [Ursidibacter maritimus]MBV6525433.1 hypothetical protein [Ursidibacter maritimus]MBV6526903.1 hypothetical protein [Ursidibacter maritimus]MBV6530284.1 hypothetical protein [Ursidibacter maritimus]
MSKRPFEERKQDYLTEREDRIDKPVIAAFHVKGKGNILEFINLESTYGRNVSQINEDLK